MKKALIAAVAAVGMMSFAVAPAYAKYYGAWSVSDDKTGVGSGVDYDEKTPEKAEYGAQVECYKSSYRGCRVIHTWSKGCSYVSVGMKPNGENGWGSGTTANAAVISCESVGLMCRHAEGGCIHS